MLIQGISLLSSLIKEEVQNDPGSTMCTYAGCGVNNDGWPWRA